MKQFCLFPENDNVSAPIKIQRQSGVYRNDNLNMGRLQRDIPFNSIRCFRLCG